MLSQQTEIELQTSNQNHITSHSHNLMSHQPTIICNSPHQENVTYKVTRQCLSDNNCNSDSQDPKGNNQSQMNTQVKLKKLQQLYNHSLQKLKSLSNDNDEQYQLKSQAKAALEAQLSQFLNPYKQINTKPRKGSQTSTAGEDQQMKVKTQKSEGRAEQNIAESKAKTNEFKQQQCPAANNQLFHQLQQKLHSIRQTNQEASKKQQQRIEQLKAALQNVQTPFQSTQIPQQNLQQSITLSQLQSKAQILYQQKTSLTQQQTILQQKILQSKRSIIHFSNSAEYLRSTQNCCQQILNEQLCSLQYKIQGKRLEYDSNKRYLDKVLRSRKYEDNVSFQDTISEINHLNDLCEEMMDRKANFLAPDIKKYKQKRLQIMEVIKEIKEQYNILESKKTAIQLQTKQQNKIFDELQDQYCALLQKVDEKGLLKLAQISSEEKLTLLKDKKTKLQEGLKQIVTKFQQIKTQIDNDQSLIPPNIVKQVKKKTQRKRQQLRESQMLTKQNTQLQKQNKTLGEEQDKIQWRSKPQIQHLNREEKEVKAAINVLEQSLKALKENNDCLEGKIKKIEEEQKLRKEEISTESNEEKTDKILREKEQQERLQREEEQKKLINRSKLIDKFRQKPQDNILDQQQDQKQKPSKQSVYDPKRNTKGKRGKKGSQINDSRRDFFVARENPLETLRRDFPLNRPSETSQNLSLLQSDPALYMFLIYFTVVLPGLCLGYCL